MGKEHLAAFVIKANRKLLPGMLLAMLTKSILSTGTLYGLKS